MKNNTENINTEYQKSFFCYPGLILMAMVLIIAISIAIPPKAIISDLLFTISLCLTAVIPMIALSAKQPNELAGFPAMLFATTIFRTTFTITTIKTALKHDLPGKIVSSAAQIINPENLTNTLIPLASVAILALLLSVVMLLLAKKRTALALKSIIPAKRLGLDADLLSGILDQTKAANLTKRINSETAFYDGLNTISKILIAFSIVTTLAVATILYSLYNKYQQITLQFSPILTAALIDLTLLTIASTFSAIMANKGSFKLKPLNQNNSKQNNSDAFTNTLKNVDKTKEFELINPDFENVAKIIEKTRPQTQKQNNESQRTFISDFEPQNNQSDNNRAKFELEKAAKAQQNETETQPPAYATPEEYYQDIAELILLDTDIKTIFMFSENTENIPVTIPVNTAIRLSQQNKKTLIIDSDPRQPIRKVFDLETTPEKITQTFIESIYALDITLSTEQNHTELAQILQKYTPDFDFILLYAPSTEQQETQKLAKLFAGAMNFSETKPKPQKVDEIFKNNNCELIATFQPPLNIGKV